jgi:hypothetical protein
MKKLAPFGKALNERIKWKNPPSLIVIYIGEDSFDFARNYPEKSFSALALTSEQQPEDINFNDVFGIPVLINWLDDFIPISYIVRIVKCLLLSRAKIVSVLPLFVDESDDILEWDTEKQKFIQLRHTLKNYQKG